MVEGREEEGWMGRGYFMQDLKIQRSLNALLSLRMPVNVFELRNVHSFIHNLTKW